MPCRRSRSYSDAVHPAVLVPVKSFGAAKQRLSGVLSDDQRRRLARWLAGRVLAAAGEIPVFVACDDPVVREWATDRGAHVVWGPGLGLNGAVDDGIARIHASGFDHVTVAHADLPHPDGLTRIAAPGVTTLVPDRRRDGTNVMSFPTAAPLPATYGPGSFQRHLAAAERHAPFPYSVVADPWLALDIDTPTDLTHPSTSEVLPAWLPTIPANRFIHGR